MKLTTLKIADLHEAKRNVRIHSQKQIEEMMKSLNSFQQFRAIVCDENHEILVGNGLYLAMLQAGYEEADCYVIEGLSENEKEKLMLADNKIYSLGVDDLDAFEDIVKELNGDFNIPGYDNSLLETLTFDFSDADEFMSGYGTIDIDTKSSMERAAEKYGAEEAEFASSAVEIRPAAANSQLQRPTSVENDANHIGAGDESQNSVETPKMLERRFLVCPKCGEKIWL